MAKKTKEQVVSAKEFDRIMEVFSGVLDDTVGRKHKNGPYLKSLMHLMNAHVHPHRFRKLPADLQKTLHHIRVSVNIAHAKAKTDMLDKVIKDNKKNGTNK